MGETDYDELIRMMMNSQQPDYFGETRLQQGLLGSTPASDLVNAESSAENILNSMQSKNQANTQNMMETGQQGIQAGMQSAQGLQAQRQADMNATAQQAAQALQQQQQQQAGLGNLLGGLISHFFIPVKYGGGRK